VDLSDGTWMTKEQTVQFRNASTPRTRKLWKPPPREPPFFNSGRQSSADGAPGHVNDAENMMAVLSRKTGEAHALAETPNQ